MASTELAPAVQPLGPVTPADLEMLNSLVVQSGWNQTADDWGVFSRHGSIGTVRDAQARIVASGAVLPMGESLHGGRVAWISMILVASSERGRGLGRLVFDYCLREAQAAGHIPMLDATPQGEPLYRQFGFEPLWRLTRWRREAVAGSGATLTSSMPHLESIASLDAEALGFDRAGVLGELFGRADSRCLRSPEAVGLLRRGRVAHHVGPLLATDEVAAIALLARLAAAVAGPVQLDVPDGHDAVARALAAAGFAPQRSFTRMALAQPGQEMPQGKPSLIHAIAGPEFG